jgi:hypothetical protein
VSEARLRRILIPITAAIVLAYYLFFVLPGLGFYFDNDDMMNLYLAWSRPLMETYRPTGALFYRTVFAAAGFNPFPFRVVCLILGALNMGLCFRFARLVSSSDRAAALAVLLFAFHTRMMEVWYRTAVVYDLLCFTFFYLAACLYMSRPRIGALRGTAIVACFIAALGAKENAVALPVVLAAWWLLRGNSGRVDLWVPLVCGLLDIPYIWFKTHGANALTNIAAYQPEYSFSRFSHTWALYLNYLFVGTNRIVPWMAIAILAALLAAALLTRSRKLLFAWIVLFVPALPIAFLVYRGGFVLYTSYPGWTVYASLVLVALQDLIPVNRTALACLVFVIVGWRFGKINLHDQRADPKTWLYQSATQVRQMVDEMTTIQPRLPKGARCLFLEDAFGTDEWTPYFIMKLMYADDTLVADRVKMMDNRKPDLNSYRYVFTFADGHYRRLKP